MTKEEAIKILEEGKQDEYTRYQFETCLWTAVDMAIEALKTKKPKFTQVAIETDVYWLERQLDMYKEKIYLNEQTMIVYVPLVTAELVTSIGGTINRVGEEE